VEKLPAASPELNPAERFFEALRRELSNRSDERLDELEERLPELLQKCRREPKLVKSLTGYPCITTSNHS
jgi:transposase